MREIKIRAWDERKKEFNKGPVAISNDGVLKMTDSGGWIDTSLIAHQFIGHKDENGAEIYEGDIVNCKGGEFCQGFWEFQKKCIVKWQKLGFDLFDLVDAESNYVIGHGFFDIFEHFEVMGNKYENPELMEYGGKEGGTK